MLQAASSMPPSSRLGTNLALAACCLPWQVSNAAYQSKLGCRPGGKEAMAAIGFK